MTYLVREDGNSYDMDGYTYIRHPFPSNFLGLWAKSFKNERRALERIVGLEDAEQLEAQELNGSFVSRHPSGKPLEDARELPRDYFDELKTLIQRIHGREVAGLNYDNPRSVLMGALGNPVITKFSRARVYEPSTWTYPDTRTAKYRQMVARLFSKIRKMRFEEAKSLDLDFVAYLKVRYSKTGITPEDLNGAMNFESWRLGRL